MNWNSYTNSNSLEDNLLSNIGSTLRISIKENNEALILLSSDLNSLSLYKRFAEIKKIDWSKVKFGMVDEKWISNDSNENNYHNISNALGKNITDKSYLTPLVFDFENEQNNILLAKSSNSVFLDEKTIVILNLETDGQIASLYPDNDKTENAISQIKPNIVEVFSNKQLEKRISHNLKSILNTKNIILYLKGDDIKVTLEKAKTELLPISYILNSISTQLEIYWTK
jgi:6-phosphogluconolactonase